LSAIPIRIPEQWEPAWFRRFYVEVLAGEAVRGLTAHNADPQAHSAYPAHPVGSLYFSSNATDPNVSIGYGTWVAFGSGTTEVSGATVHVWERTE
jgi:hypothetical protein